MATGRAFSMQRIPYIATRSRRSGRQRVLERMTMVERNPAHGGAGRRRKRRPRSAEDKDGLLAGEIGDL